MPAHSLIIEAALDLAWSHWSGLGVRGVVAPPDSAVDPEALLYLTACLADHDPRLGLEVADWWSRYHQHVSRPRLKALARRFSDPVVRRFKAFAAWLEEPRHVSGKSSMTHLETLPRALLRLRSAFGPNARAELLLELVSRRDQPHFSATARALAEVGYSKRNTVDTLEQLRLAGMISVTSEANRARYRLADADALTALLPPLPQRWSGWHFRLPVVASFVELAGELRGRDAMVQAVEARKALAALQPLIERAGISIRPPAGVAETYWGALQRWAVDVVVTEQPVEVRLNGAIRGVWIRPGAPVVRPLRYGNAVLPRLDATADGPPTMQCLDLVQAPTSASRHDWTWAVVSTAATKVYEHTIGLDRGEAWRFATWDFGDQRVYDVRYAKPIAHGRLATTYGESAAERARPDYPAIQLRLDRVTS